MKHFKRVKKAILFTLITVVTIALIMAFVLGVAKKISDNNYEKIRFPEEGTYYCEKLDAYFLCTPDKTELVIKDLKIPIGVGYDGVICDRNNKEEENITANFFWDQKSDRIELFIREYPLEIDTGRDYIFVRTEKLPPAVG